MNKDLDSSYTITDNHIKYFRQNGYIKLKDVLTVETLHYYRKEISKMVDKLNQEKRSLEERDTYGKAFLQIENMFLHNSVVKEFVSSKRLGQIATDLLGTRGVRMYHDQALYKEAGGGFTPWHVDQVYWPFSTEKCVTAWIPLIPVTQNMGPLAFWLESHKIEEYRNLIISDESEAKIQGLFDKSNSSYDESPFDLGEVSYHYGWTFHRAGANNSDRMREIMTVIYMDIDMKITRKDEPWCPNTEAGEIPNNSTNFIIYEKDSE